jgi:hypothetical protein
MPSTPRESQRSEVLVGIADHAQIRIATSRSAVAVGRIL